MRTRPTHRAMGCLLAAALWIAALWFTGAWRAYILLPASLWYVSWVWKLDPAPVVAYTLVLIGALPAFLLAGQLHTPRVRSLVRAAILAVALSPGLLVSPEMFFLLPATLILLVSAAFHLSDPLFLAPAVVPLAATWVVAYIALSAIAKGAFRT